MRRVRRALRWLVWDGLFLLEAVRVRLVSYVEDVKVLVGTLANMALTIAGYVVLWSVLTGNVESLRGAYAEWGLGGLLVLVGFSELAFALDALITYGVALIPSIIHEEGLETYSIHPVGTLAEILGKHSEPIDGFTGLLLSMGLIAGSALAYDVPVSLLGLALGVGLLLLGLAGLTGLYLALASLSFRYGMLEAPVDFVTTVYVSFSRVPPRHIPAPSHLGPNIRATGRPPQHLANPTTAGRSTAGKGAPPSRAGPRGLRSASSAGGAGLEVGQGQLPARRGVRRGVLVPGLLLGVRLRRAYLLDYMLELAYLPVELLVFYFIYKTLYTGQPVIGGYTLEQLTVYLFTSFLLRRAYPTGVRARVERDIHDGHLIAYLVRPLGYTRFLYGLHLAGFLLLLPWIILIPALFTLATTQTPPSPRVFGLFAITSLIGFTVAFTLYTITGLASAWLGRHHWLGNLLTLSTLILGGGYIPLDLFPQPVASILRALPLQAVYNLPASTLARGTLDTGLLVGATLWIILLTPALALLSKRATSRFESAGG